MPCCQSVSQSVPTIRPQDQIQPVLMTLCYVHNFSQTNLEVLKVQGEKIMAVSGRRKLHRSLSKNVDAKVIVHKYLNFETRFISDPMSSIFKWPLGKPENENTLLFVIVGFVLTLQKKLKEMEMPRTTKLVILFK